MYEHRSSDLLSFIEVIFLFTMQIHGVQVTEKTLGDPKISQSFGQVGAQINELCEINTNGPGGGYEERSPMRSYSGRIKGNG